ncbi:MAG: deoxyribodipyrimidine photo-lyase, partial [Notoacmeibacter sp.]
MKQQSIAVVWFKRDLRVCDHAALCAAAATGLPVVPLYIVEPDYWALPDASARHYEFICDSLIDLRQALAELGQPLIVRTGDAVELFKRLHAKHSIAAIFAHEETGNQWTYQRDLKVAAFARQANIPFQEFSQNGVIRRIKTRDGWAANWDRLMSNRQFAAPSIKPVCGIEPGAIPTVKALGLDVDYCPGRQSGGRLSGLVRLGAFLTRDGLPYQRAMSFPAAGAIHCSRMSPHLAYGTLSVREIAQTTSARNEELKHPSNGEPPEWRRAMASFIGRLHWRDHFTQKLEDQTSIEFQPLHPQMRGMQGLSG